MTARPRLRVAVFPSLRSTNPYRDLLDESLRARGVEIEPGAALDPGWARAARSRVDAVHLHWLEFLFFSGGGRVRRLLSMWAQGLRVIRALRILRRSPVRVVWTIHNLEPHEGGRPLLHRALRRAVLRGADALVVHSHYARERAAAALGHGDRMWVAPHGSYAGTYPAGGPPAGELRRRLGIPADSFVYLVFGHVRRYKLVPETIAAFTRLDDPGARLVVSGSAWDAGERARVVRAAAADPRVVLDLREVPSEEVPGLFAMAGAAVIAHREVFSSSTLLLGLTFGVPAVVSTPGAATEIAPPPASVPFTAGGLPGALRAVRERSAERRGAATAAAAAQRWQDAALVLEALYRGAPPLARPAGAGPSAAFTAIPAPPTTVTG